jgi:hypothetical protein
VFFWTKWIPWNWKSSAGRLVQRLLLFKVCYLLYLVGAMLLWPVSQETEIFHSKRQHWTAAGQLSFDSHFTSWDAEHYLQLPNLPLVRFIRSGPFWSVILPSSLEAVMW